MNYLLLPVSVQTVDCLLRSWSNHYIYIAYNIVLWEDSQAFNITDYTWLREYIIEVSTVNDLLGDIQFIIKLGTPGRNRLVLQTGPGFSPGTSVSSIQKTDRHEINEIVLKVELNTHNPPLIEAKIHFEKCEAFVCFFSFV